MHQKNEVLARPAKSVEIFDATLKDPPSPDKPIHISHLGIEGVYPENRPAFVITVSPRDIPANSEDEQRRNHKWVNEYLEKRIIKALTPLGKEVKVSSINPEDPPDSPTKYYMVENCAGIKPVIEQVAKELIADPKASGLMVEAADAIGPYRNFNTLNVSDMHPAHPFKGKKPWQELVKEWPEKKTFQPKR